MRRSVPTLRPLILSALVLAAGAGPLAPAAPAQRGPGQPVRRAKPPDESWDRNVAGSFFADAFGKLQGERPSFVPGSATPDTGGGAPADTPVPVAGGFAWSTLVSEDTLTDEIKDMKALLATAAAKPSDFKGGGFEDARGAFSVVALVFGVIAAYDGDVRWKKDAATARDLFARAGFNCKVGTDQSFAEAKLRLTDLESLLDGSPPAGKPDRDEDFRWSQVAGRPALMTRLAGAEQALSAATASKGDFTGAVDRLVHDAEIVAAIAEVIHQPDFEFHDDEGYAGYATAMRDAAMRARDAARKKDYDAARSAVGQLKKSCDDCHGGYRS